MFLGSKAPVSFSGRLAQSGGDVPSNSSRWAGMFRAMALFAPPVHWLAQVGGDVPLIHIALFDDG